MDLEEKKFRDTEKLLHQSGYTLTELMMASSRYNSSLLMVSNEDNERCKALYNDIKKGELTRGQKGQKLEEMTSILFEKSVENLFDVYRNCRTSTNEIDLLIRWTENARLSGINNAFSCFGESFLVECKNYDGPVSVTFVGKFCSLMSVTNTNFGIMVSWDGVSGRTKWNDSKGLIKKIALHESKYIIVIDKNDLKQICDRKKNLFSLIYDKYVALKEEIDYETYIVKHEAEDCMI